MLLKVDLTSDIPIYQQIRNQIILGLATGKLDYGEDLPSARILAQSLGVNFMTVNKAYKLLRREGIIEVDRTKGTKVREDIVKDLDQVYFDNLRLIIAEGLIKSKELEGFYESIQKILEEFSKEG
ncbi:MAG: GntR family transcriptional regulator [Tissierellia bacterium]|nr:GntR family transcriptional regulator [Tissierellia bacterium]